MINKFKSFLKTNYTYILCLTIPIIIMACYFAYRNMFPFGKGSILTVDLGQQYVDFFAYYRRTILSGNYQTILYSFSNGYGGEMLGIWAYYLLSPFNLIILMFPAKLINAAILIITIIKYGMSGLTFSIFLKHKKIRHPLLIIAMSVAYSLNGWIIANQLNLMWLDAMILLPLIAMGIDYIISKNQMKIFIISFAALLIINYYMAYMVGIFTIIYFLAEFIINFKALKKCWIPLVKMVVSLVTSILISSFIFVPNLLELNSGKGSYTIQKIHWHFEYNPFYMISKLFNGSFNFNQMPSGYPNIFIGAIATIGFILFFCNRHITLKRRISYAVITLILILSMCFEPLDLLWHAMQFPIWYPYRFSFIFCFWMIYLSSIALNNYSNRINIKAVTILSLILIAGFIYIAANNKTFNFMSMEKYFISLTFATISFLVIILSNKKSKSYWISLVVIVICDAGLNVFNSLNSISYVSNNDYVQYTSMLKENVRGIANPKYGFYRIGKDFYRSRDDSIQANYDGGSIFSSTLQKSTPTFNGNIGSAYTTGSIDYSNGTLVSDSMLNFAYFIKNNSNSNDYPMIQKSSPRYDLKHYELINDSEFPIYHSNFTLPSLYTTSGNVFSNINSMDPIDYQNKMVKQITTQNNNVFIPFNNYQVISKNANNVNNITQQVFKKRNLLKNSTIHIKYNGNHNQIFYMVIPSSLNQKNCSIIVNGQDINLPDNFESTFVVSLPNMSKNNITIQLKTNTIYTNEFNIYNLNLTRYLNSTKQIRKQDNKISFKNNSIHAIVSSHNNDQLATSIPYSKGWSLKIDGHNYPIKLINKEFIGTDNLPKGKHKVVLSYYPVGLNLGILITLVTTALIILISLFKRRIK